MIRCVRLWTGRDGGSHVQIGRLELQPGRNDDLVSPSMPTEHVTVEETAGGGALAWHTAPVRQLVLTLSGTLHFVTRDGERFTLHPGDVLLAEDTAGSGHQWQLEGDDPWRRMYVVLAAGTEVPFVADQCPATTSDSSTVTGSLAPGRKENNRHTKPNIR
jgi:quercetin dioxygenase-like cupin family protein